MLPRLVSTSAARAAEARGRQLQRLVSRRPTLTPPGNIAAEGPRVRRLPRTSRDRRSAADIEDAHAGYESRSTQHSFGEGPHQLGRLVIRRRLTLCLLLDRYTPEL